MEAYKRGGHKVWDCKYHLVWVTKYLTRCLDVGVRCRELLCETARAHEMVVHAGSINRDHVHMLLSIPPSLSVSRAVQHLKGRKFAQASERVRPAAQALLGPASVGEALLATSQTTCGSTTSRTKPRLSPMTTSMSRELPPCPPNGGPIRL
jgi:REP element-mobilizing transposase RayT